MRRIDYIRQTKSVPRNGLNAPPGQNPYDAEYGVLPYGEIMRLLDKHIPIRPNRLRKKAAERDLIITQKDLFKYMGRVEEGLFADFRRGDDSKLGRIRLRKLSRILLQIESGQLVMRDGKLTLTEPETEAVAPWKPDMVYRVVLETGPRGVLRPTIVPGAPREAPKTMPKLFQSFKLPGS